MNYLDIANIAVKLNLRESDLLDILHLLKRQKTIDNNELVRLTGIPKTNLGRILKEFSNYLEPVSDKVTLRPKAIEEIKNLLEEIAEKTNDREVETEIRQILTKYKTERPTPERSLDQFTATDETTANRALYLKQRGDILGRKVAFIGDDDLTSVAVALLKQAEKITVFEIDKRLTSLIEKISHEENLQIEIVNYDARRLLVAKYLNQYDTVFTDPPYTPNGISLFLNRGIELIKNRLQSRIYVCYGNSDRARERELEIQRLINKRGLLVKAKLENFNKYYGAESIGSISSLYLCDWTPKTKIVRTEENVIYTNQIA